MKKSLWFLTGFATGIAVLNHTAILCAGCICLVTILVECLVDEK